MNTLLTLLLSTMLGHWFIDTDRLPAFSYDAPLPFECTTPDGKTPQMRNDPWFLLGNYRITVFVHVDGTYELISGERSWTRLNQGERVNSGVNDAYITIAGKRYQLTGKGSLAEDNKICARVFGCGYAEWTFRIDGLEIVRRMQVEPSLTMDGGQSAVLITTEVKNSGRSSREIGYDESVTANFRHAQFQRYNNSPVRFDKHPAAQGDMARIDFTAKADNPLDIPAREELSTIDAYAPSLYVAGTGAAASDDGKLSTSQTFTLKRGEKKTIGTTVGFMFDADFDKIQAVRNSWGQACWRDVLPTFDDETDRKLARELTWHAYNLEAMATWSAYYHETKIPQGTVYDYYWGQHASARDNFQHALAPIYYHPELARSILRYMAMRTTETGEIRLIESGYGNADPSVYNTSDQQLFYFYAISEYLRVTGDTGFLDTTIQYYPKANEGTMLEVTEKCFDYLRNFVGTGPHGLIRLLNSDWLDNVYGLYEVRYNEVIYSSESHMNSAMALAILPNLIRQLRNYDGAQKVKAQRLAEGMQLYYASQLKAIMADLGERSYSRRMYYGKMTIGEDYMCLEPQAYLLLAEDFPVERKRVLYEEMTKRLFDGEALGACQNEKPVEGYDFLPPGARDNGGFWYSLNGPAICGIATFDKQEAMRRLHQMSFINYALRFPDYWTSYWSSSDNNCPSICGSFEGLPDQSWDYFEIPVYCAHPHAWMLYCYYKLKE